MTVKQTVMISVVLFAVVNMSCHILSSNIFLSFNGQQFVIPTVWN